MRRRAWPGSKWRTTRRPGVFLLRPRWARSTLVLRALIVTVICFVAGAALTFVDNAGNDLATDPVQRVVVAISVTIVFGGPVIGAMVVIGRMRRRAIISTSAGLWIWSGRSDLYVEWKEIAGVAVVPAARRNGAAEPSGHARHWCPAVTTHRGQQFELSTYRARARDGQLRPRSRCRFGADNVAAMFTFATGAQAVPAGGEPAARLANRSWEARRSLPVDANVLPLPGIVRKSAARTAAACAVGGGVIGFRIATAQTPHMDVAATIVTLGVTIGAMGMLFGSFIWLLYRELAWGADWLAWRLRIVGRWRTIPLARILRIDVPVANPVRTRMISSRLAIAIRMDDGRTRLIRPPELADSGQPLRERLTALVNGPLAHVSTDRAREYLNSGWLWASGTAAPPGTPGWAGPPQPPPYGPSFPYGHVPPQPPPYGPHSAYPPPPVPPPWAYPPPNTPPPNTPPPNTPPPGNEGRA